MTIRGEGMITTIITELTLDFFLIPIAFILSKFILKYDIKTKEVFRITAIYTAMMVLIGLLIKVLNTGNITQWLFIAFKHVYGILVIFYILGGKRIHLNVSKSLKLAVLTVFIKVFFVHILYFAVPSLNLPLHAL